MKKKPVIEPFKLTPETISAVMGHFDAILGLCPFLTSLVDDDRKVLLKVEEEKISRPIAVYETLVETPTLNKSETLILSDYAAHISRYQNVYSFLKKADSVRLLFSDTVLCIGHELALTTFEGQKQIKRAAEDDADTYSKTYKEVLNVKKESTEITPAQMEKLALKFGYVKTLEEPKK